ncbi:etoposide-induced protein 2.4-domain-containing protein [Spinellus fusiger]|nr:etoposide-induced protein 2.4-domain-containing protein [Spinellus fusiger]
MYFLLLALNGTFYNPIAEKAYQVQLARTNKTGAAGNTNGLVNAVQSMAETIYTILFYISCGVFATFLYSIPYIGIFLSFFMNCAIMSYYCFEYKWGYLGWTLEQRLTYLENHWAFFLGFGVPSTLLTFFLSTLYSGAIFALIYPSYVIMATMATAQPISSHSQPIASGHAARKEWNLPKKVPIFYPVRKMLDVVILVVRLVGGVHADSIVSEKKKASINKKD